MLVIARRAVVVLGCVLFTHSAFAAPSFVPERWATGFDAVNAQLEKNLKAPDHSNPFWHAHPAPKYPGVYLWDSAFISLIWLHHNSNVAKEVVRAVLHNQQADGRIPHEKNIFGTSPWTQPPVLGWATAKIVAQTGDVAYAREIFPKMARYNDWLFTHRRLKTGLFFWQHPYESGIDNAPRFGNRDESHYIDTTVVESVDMSSYVVMDSEAMASIAGFLASNTPDQPAHDELLKEQAKFQDRANAVAALMRTRLWDEKTGYFYDRSTVTGQFIAIPTIASLFPLTAGVADAHQATLLMAHILNPNDFNTPIPFVTVARTNEYFEKDMWRGPIWINTAYLVIQGMKRYGHEYEAREMGARLVDGVFSTWHYTGKIVEFYDPENYDFHELSRKKGLGPLGLSASHNPIAILEHLIGKELFLGTKPVDHFVGWTGLVNNLVIEDQLVPPPNAPAWQ